jgi:transitional endoplasmic reticulum ATPase
MPQKKVLLTRSGFAVKRFLLFFVGGMIFSQGLAYYFKQPYQWLMTIDTLLVVAVLFTLSSVLGQQWLYDIGHENSFKKIGKFKVNLFGGLIALYGWLVLLDKWLVYIDFSWFYHLTQLTVFAKAIQFAGVIQTIDSEYKLRATTFVAMSTLMLFAYRLIRANEPLTSSEKWGVTFFAIIILLIQYFFYIYLYCLTTIIICTVFFVHKPDYDAIFPKIKINSYQELENRVFGIFYKFLGILNSIDGIMTILLVFSSIAILILKLSDNYISSWWTVIGCWQTSIIIFVLIYEPVKNSLFTSAVDALRFAVTHNRTYHQKTIELLINASTPNNVNTLVRKSNAQIRDKLVQSLQQSLSDTISPPFEARRVDKEYSAPINQQTTEDNSQNTPPPNTKAPETTDTETSNHTSMLDFENIAALGKKITGRFTNKQSYSQTLTEKQAVQLAYSTEIKSIASILKVGLSVLVSCDKLVVEHLWQAIIKEAGLQPIELQVSDMSTQSTLLNGQLSLMRKQIEAMQKGEVLVVPHLDLLAGGSASYLSDCAREFVELVYRASDHCILAFTDISLEIPDVLATRFSTRKTINGVPRTVMLDNKQEVPLGQLFVTETEVRHIKDYDAEGLYKNISGMNPLQIRHAITYAIQAHSGQGQMSMEQLYQSIRDFKAKTSSNFEIPDVSFADIGGYELVKTELLTAIDLLEGTYSLSDEKLKKELIPRGFIFHGPPGTGKTLFAKAVASRLQATVMVVSGPETIDKWLGESEKKVRELFAEARRNAPSVLIFDEFDAIAGKRTNNSDGGSRAINSMVAQILTEMDGFRPDVPMLVIGTTNRLDIIDDAFLRPSRFQAIAINLPDKIARRAIAAIYAKKFKIIVSEQVLDAIADTSQGFNGDEIQAIFRNLLIDLLRGGQIQLPVQADACRLGEMVGGIRRNKTEQQRGGGITITLN